jgi:hypothetical protein
MLWPRLVGVAYGAAGDTAWLLRLVAGLLALLLAAVSFNLKHPSHFAVAAVTQSWLPTLSPHQVRTLPLQNTGTTSQHHNNLYVSEEDDTLRVQCSQVCDRSCSRILLTDQPMSMLCGYSLEALADLEPLSPIVHSVTLVAGSHDDGTA